MMMMAVIVVMRTMMVVAVMMVAVTGWRKQLTYSVPGAVLRLCME